MTNRLDLHSKKKINNKDLSDPHGRIDLITKTKEVAHVSKCLYNRKPTCRKNL
jgi:hypothetical protein